MYAVHDGDCGGRAPFRGRGRAAYADFFSGCLRFHSAAADLGVKLTTNGATNVVVLSAKLADRLFPHGDAVGRIINLTTMTIGSSASRSVESRAALLRSGLRNRPGRPEDVFLPFATAVIWQMERPGPIRCNIQRDFSKEDYPTIDCNWIQFWVNCPRLPRRAVTRHSCTLRG